MPPGTTFELPILSVMSEENGCCANINNGSFKKDDCYNHTQLLIKKLKFSTKICSTIIRFLSMRQNVKNIKKNKKNILKVSLEAKKVLVLV